MTTPVRFEQDLPALLADTYLAGIPDYRDDLVQELARTPQRPAWAIPGRWLPMDLVTERARVPRAPWRALATLTLIALLILALAAAYVGARRPVPAPFGIAANGQIVYADGGDIVVRDTLDGPARVVVAGPTDDHDPWFSPDGLRMIFTRTDSGYSFLWAADADGSHQRQLTTDPIDTGYGAWSPDSRSIAWVDRVNLELTLSILSLDGSPARTIDLHGIQPSDLAWQPPDGRQLLFRGEIPGNTVDLYLVNGDGTGAIRPLGLPSVQLFGDQWENSGPVWSPDGSTIAYNVVEPSTAPDNGHFRVHLVNADGTNDRAIAGPADPAVQEAWPIFSPDGRHLVMARFTFGSDGQGWLSVGPADGSTPARDVEPRIHGGDQNGIIKAWSPDGMQILARADLDGAVYTVDPDTGVGRKLDVGTPSLPDWQRRAP